MRIRRMDRPRIAGLIAGVLIGSFFMPKVEAARAERRYQIEQPEEVKAAAKDLMQVRRAAPVLAEIPTLVRKLVWQRDGVSYINLGTFKLTAYCPCKRCCGQWSRYRRTASRTKPKAGWTAAVDSGQIPLGTLLVIDDHQYIAEDTGIGVGEDAIDIFMDNHEGAIEFGVQYSEVWAACPNL